MNELLRRRLMMSGGENDTLTIKVKTGHISNNSKFVYSSGWYCSETFLQVKAGDEVVFSCYGGAANAVIYTYYSDSDTYMMKVQGGGSTNYRTYTWTADANCTVGLSAKIGATAPQASLNGRTIEFINYDDLIN